MEGRSKGRWPKRARAEMSFRARYFAALPTGGRTAEMRRRARGYAYSFDTTSSDKPPIDALPLRRRRTLCRYPLFALFADYRPAPMTCLPPIRSPPTCFRSEISSTDTPPPAVFKTNVKAVVRVLFFLPMRPRLDTSSTDTP